MKLLIGVSVSFILLTLATIVGLYNIRSSSSQQTNHRSNRKFQIPIFVSETGIYLAKIKVGQPPQWFDVQLDTMNADFWLVDSTCDSVQCIGRNLRKHRFNCSDSKTCQSNGTKFLIEYEGHGVEGILAQDDMTINEMIVPKVGFGRGILLNQYFGPIALDGIMGIGLPESSQTGIKSPLQRAMEMVSDSMLTLWLNREGGLLTLGDDNRNCDSKWTFSKTKGRGYWQLELTKFSMSDFTSGIADVILDIATDFIHAPTNIFTEIVERLNATHVKDYDIYVVSCKTIESAPPLKFNIGGKLFSVPSISYIQDLNFGKGLCAVCIRDSAIRDPQNRWLFGKPFLSDNHCTAFDFERRQIGFTKVKNKSNH
ncbi:Renin-like isoform X2 [Aphelenchoides besseyi]|nr:Renin-like isoform X2 [Aphelenchoides besseyi]